MGEGEGTMAEIKQSKQTEVVWDIFSPYAHL